MALHTIRPTAIPTAIRVTLRTARTTGATLSEQGTGHHDRARITPAGTQTVLSSVHLGGRQPGGPKPLDDTPVMGFGSRRRVPVRPRRQPGRRGVVLRGTRLCSPRPGLGLPSARAEPREIDWRTTGRRPLPGTTIAAWGSSAQGWRRGYVDCRIWSGVQPERDGAATS
jgi:hypothetical protein